MVVGGVIPDEDVPELKKLGASDVFVQDTTPDTIVGRMRDIAAGGGRRRRPSGPRATILRYRPAADRAAGGVASWNAPTRARAMRYPRQAAPAVRYAWEKAPFYRRKWEEAGVSPTTLQSLDDLAKFPVVQKSDLRAAQAQRPPFGDYLCIDPHEVARIHGTSGTTGRPTVFGVSADDWERIGEPHARDPLGRRNPARATGC